MVRLLVRIGTSEFVDKNPLHSTILFSDQFTEGNLM